MEQYSFVITYTVIPKCDNNIPLVANARVSWTLETDYNTSIVWECFPGYSLQTGVTHVLYRCNSLSSWEVDTNWPLDEAPRCTCKV